MGEKRDTFIEVDGADTTTAAVAHQTGAIVRGVREHLGLTQAEVARRADMKPAALARLEGGGVNPSVKTLSRLFDAMGVVVTIAFVPGNGGKGGGIEGYVLSDEGGLVPVAKRHGSQPALLPRHRGRSASSRARAA